MPLPGARPLRARPAAPMSLPRLPRLDALSQASIRRPRLTLALLAGFTLAAAPGLARLELRTDGRELAPANDPAVRR